MAKLKVTWVKSAIGYPENQKRTIEALGLKRLHSSKEFEDSGAVRGMITKVRHLVQVEAVEIKTPVKRRARTKPVKEENN